MADYNEGSYEDNKHRPGYGSPQPRGMGAIVNENTFVKRYAPNKEDVQAILLTEASIRFAARWCGGEVKGEPKASDPSDIYYFLAIPSLTGPFEARMGMYLIKRSDGKFDVARAVDFKAEYHVVGLRQDGIQFTNTTTRGGVISSHDEFGPTFNTVVSNSSG